MVSHIDERKDGVLKPFLRWAGGKQKLLKYLLKYVPEDYMKNTYFEPFLGAGSLFLALRPRKAVISDLNSYLIDCYKAILQNPREVHRNLKIHIRKHSEIYYYKIRDIFNENAESTSYTQAARFIYLNKTCFNGIFRVNQSGFFNVPYGKKRYPNISSLHELKAISHKLRIAEIICMPYEKILSLVKKKDFVYLDPPYPPLTRSANFTHYTARRFTLSDHKKIANLAKKLDHIGCRVLISNADIDDIPRLYHGWNKQTVNVVRYISCCKERLRLKELLIYNYRM